MNKRTLLGVILAAAIVGIALFAAASHETPPWRDGEAIPPPTLAAHTGAPALGLRADIGAIPDDTGKFGVKSTDFDGSISGIDANRNGVRDDIERHIADLYKDAKQRAAMMQFAKSQQEMILRGTTPEGAAQATDDLLQSLACLRERVGDGYLNASRDVLAMMLNTEDRFRAYIVARGNQAGQLYYGYQGNQPCA